MALLFKSITWRAVKQTYRQTRTSSFCLFFSPTLKLKFFQQNRISSISISSFPRLTDSHDLMICHMKERVIMSRNWISIKNVGTTWKTRLASHRLSPYGVHAVAASGIQVQRGESRRQRRHVAMRNDPKNTIRKGCRMRVN